MSSNLNTQNEFELTEALLSSERQGGYSISIPSLITDFEIYEHMDKPFLSARFAIVDTSSLFERTDIQGGETLTITIQSSETKDVGNSITKSFIIDKILKSTRADEKTEIVYLHGYEDILFKSSLKNISKHYKGNPSDIIGKILQEYLGKDVLYSTEEYQANMELIVPNLDPIDAAVWIKNRMTNADGLPYYLWSTLASDSLYLIDLGTILLRPPINTRAPFLYIQGAAQHLEQVHIPIMRYNHENIEDVLTLIRKGHVGAQYNFLNTLTGTNSNIEFDVSNDAFYPLAEKDYLKEQPKFVYAPEQGIDGVAFSSHTSKIITKIAGAGAYTYDNYRQNSIDEETEMSAYKKRVIGDSIKSFMTKTPISITIPGKPLLRGDGDYTVGNVARVLFLEATHNEISSPSVDSKKSGDYVLYATKHSFAVREPNRVDSTLLCAKLSSFEPGISIEDFINVS